MEDVRAAIAENIAELRQSAGLTQTKLADILNYSDKAVSKWERAEAVPDIVTIKQIADYFGVSVDYLLTRKHSASELPADSKAQRIKKNHFWISALAAMLVWFLGALVFTVLSLVGIPHAWCAFVGALPIFVTVILVFNSVWGRRRMNFLIITFLSWSVLVAAHLTVLAYAGKNLWQLYLVGAPAQVIIVLSTFIRFKKR